MAPALDAVPPVDDRIGQMVKRLKERIEESEMHFPGLADVLTKYLENSSDDPARDSVDHEAFTRGLLHVFWKSDDMTYERILKSYSETEQQKIKAFVEEGKPASELAGDFSIGTSPGVREEMSVMDAHKKNDLVSSVERHIEELKEKMEDITTSLKKSMGLKSDLEETGSLHFYKDARFQNWGLTVDNKPEFTFVPKTTEDVQKIVKFAVAKNLSVRCSGYRHSWSPTFSENGQVLISLLGLAEASALPNITSLPLPECAPNELQTIEFASEDPKMPLTGGKRLVRVGAAVTNERFRRWCVANKTVTLPLNVILVEVTLGGSNGPICHGAGRAHKTLSDLVKRIEYIDAHGNLREIRETDTEFLKAASGCFGLLGPITHITFELDPMTFAVMKPQKLPVALAIPPPKGMKIPAALDKHSAEELEKAREEFEKHANSDYYAEWFWFPFSDYCWVNTWSTTTDDTDVVSYPSDAGLFLQFIATVLLNVLQYTPLLFKLEDLVGFNQPGTTLQSRAAMANLPEVKPGEKPIKTLLPNALHFFRSVQNVRVMDTELEIPLLPSSSDATKPDYRLVQQAFWDAILMVYEPKNLKTVPMRMALEMRISGGSDVIMAPQRGNTLGTCSIEVLTLQALHEVWAPFAQEVVDVWMSYKDHNGKRLKSRPHWGKEWYKYKVDGKRWIEKLKHEDYKDEILEFRRIMAAIGKAHGWTLKDIKQRFSNNLYNEIFFEGI